MARNYFRASVGRVSMVCRHLHPYVTPVASCAPYSTAFPRGVSAAAAIMFVAAPHSPHAHVFAPTQGRFKLQGVVMPSRNKYITLNCNPKLAQSGGSTAATPAVSIGEVFDRIVVFSKVRAPLVFVLLVPRPVCLGGSILECGRLMDAAARVHAALSAPLSPRRRRVGHVARTAREQPRRSAPGHPL